MSHLDSPKCSPRLFKLLHLQGLLSYNLEQWRLSLPLVLQWRDPDPPCADINISRMRAMYYTVKYKIHLPVLRNALNESPPWESLDLVDGSNFRTKLENASHSTISDSRARTHIVDPASEPSSPIATSIGGSMLSGYPLPVTQRSVHSKAYSGQGTSPTSYPSPRTLTDHEQDILSSCSTCVNAAIDSILAYGGVDTDTEVHHRSLITSNIFSTAHALYGMLLVLSATYNSQHQYLSQLVNGERLHELLEWTLGVLKANGSASPAMSHDGKVIKFIRGKLFPAKC